MINPDVERAFAKMSKKGLRRFPSRRDEFDTCVSFVDDTIYFCIKVDGVWYKSTLTKI